MALRKLKQAAKQLRPPSPPPEPRRHQVNRPYFDDHLERLKLTHRQAAELLGFGADHTKATRTLNGDRDMQVEEVPRWAYLFGVPVTEIMENLGIRVPERVSGEAVVPIKGWVDSLGMVHMARPATGPRMAAAPPGMHGGEALRYQASGSPMDGWVGLYTPVAHISRDALDRLCVIQTAEGTWMVRVLKRGYEVGSWNLVPFCGAGEVLENARIKSAVPVMYFRTN